MSKKIQAMTPAKGVKITTDMVQAFKNRINPGDVILQGVIAGVYPFFMTVHPFGSRHDKMEAILWTDYFMQASEGSFS